MKLAEALQARSDLNRQIEQLEQRITNNCLVQEGEEPNEKPGELFREFEKSAEELEKLIVRINTTNCSTAVEGQTLTALIARRDVLQKKIAVYKNTVAYASSNTRRATRSEIKVLSTIDVRSFQKLIDKMSRQLRDIDNLIQATNWNTELL